MQRMQLLDEPRMMLDEETKLRLSGVLLRCSRCSRFFRVRTGGVHEIALLSLSVREGAAFALSIRPSART
jgi:hypothetical protein